MTSPGDTNHPTNVDTGRDVPTLRFRPLPGHGYPDNVRDQAIDVMRVTGLAAAHASTGISRQTLSRWARQAGIDLGAVSVRTRAAAQASAAQTAKTTAERLERILELATTALTRSLEALTDVLELDDDDLGAWSEELQRFVPADDQSTAAKVMRRHQLVQSTGVSARELSTVVSTAVKDLALLRGEATSRGAFTVSFAVPRPDPVTVVVVPQERLELEW